MVTTIVDNTTQTCEGAFRSIQIDTMKRPSPFLSSSSGSSSSDSDNDEENYKGSDFPNNTNFPGFGDFGNFDSDSFSQQPPPHLRRLVAEGEDGGCATDASAGVCNDHGGSGSGGGGDDDNGHNHNRGYEDGLVDLLMAISNNPNPNNNNGNDDDSHRYPRVRSYLDISDGSGTYSYGRAYLHLLLDALTNHPETVHVVDGSYFENMDLQYSANPKYLFRFASNGKVFARLYVDLPPHTLPPQSSIVDPRPTQDPGSSCTICPTCHRTRSFDDDDARAEAEENKQSKGLQADQEMKQCSSEQNTQKSSTDKKQDTVNEQDEKPNTNEQKK